MVRPGGRFHFLEHGLSPDERVATWQRRLEPTQRRLADWLSPHPRSSQLVRDAGFEMEQVSSRYAHGPKPWSWFTEGVALNP